MMKTQIDAAFEIFWQKNFSYLTEVEMHDSLIDNIKEIAKQSWINGYDCKQKFTSFAGIPGANVPFR